MLTKGYEVYGTYRRLSTPNFWRLHYLGIDGRVKLLPVDMLDTKSIADSLAQAQPSEVYHLAAQSFVGASFSQPIYTSNVTGLGSVRVLDELIKFDNKIKFYHASSSEMYGNEPSQIKTEATHFEPASPYAAAKLYAHSMVNIYRKAYGIYAASGILFNHESPLRGLEFVTRKISNGVAKISLGLIKTLTLGNLSAKRDWGYAPEYVEGMWLMLQQKEPDTYILATSNAYSVEEFVNEACKVADISKSKIISTKENFRPYDVGYLKGDYRKANKKLGWKPKTNFNKLVKIMVEEDVSRWVRWLKGESFPWDANMAGEQFTVSRKNTKIATR